jgi:hypothetical protein
MSNCSNCSLTIEDQAQNGFDACDCSVANCTTCSSDGTGCAECEATYTFGTNKLCYNCDDSNCMTCSADSATCSACKSGFAKVSGVCEACSAGCSACASATECSVCLPEYFASANTGC